MNVIRTHTLADQLVEQISRDIFLDVFEVGSSLPPLRKLATRYGVTVPTTQRAIARIEEMGLVAVRHGSGIRVLDPKLHASLSAFPYWMDALRQRPEEARILLEDFLELRRDLAVSLLERVAGVSTQELEPVILAINAFEEVVQGDPSFEELAQADLAVARALLQVRPQAAFSTIFNVFERLLMMIEELQVAMYATPSRNVSGYRLVLSVLGQLSPNTSIRLGIVPVLSALDQITIERFEAELRKNKGSK